MKANRMRFIPSILLLSLLLTAAWSILAAEAELSAEAPARSALPPDPPTPTPTLTTEPTATNTPTHTSTPAPTSTPTSTPGSQLLPIIAGLPESLEWRAAPGDWPDESGARHLALCDDVLFAASENTIYWSALNGTWQPLDGPTDPPGTITGLELSPPSENECANIYLSVRDTGVFRGTLDMAGNPISVDWVLLENRDDVSQVRAIALSGDQLFAAGEFGLGYWDESGMEWKVIDAVPGDPVQPIMDLAVADTDDAIKPVYAVRWFDFDIWWNPNPETDPEHWVEHPAPRLIDLAVRVIFGNELGPLMVGSSDRHYRLPGGTWEEVVLPGFGSVAARAFAARGTRTFAGYVGGPGAYTAVGDSQFLPLNHGWTDPPEIYDLAIYGGGTDQLLLAATSIGVWAYPIGRLD